MSDAVWNEMWLSCLHESAHCVTHLELGGTVIEVAVDGATGWFKPRGIVSAVTLLSGYCAEWCVTNPGETPVAADFAENWGKEDVRRASDRIGSTNGDLLRAVWIEARKLVDREWPTIERLGDSLWTHGRLSGDEAEALWRQRRIAA